MVTVRTAVIPAAGRGTRFLPASKVVPKELIPLVDRPVLELVVEEAAAAGLTRVCVVTSRDKPAVRAHFEPAPALEEALIAKGDDDGLRRVRNASTLAAMDWVFQDSPKGLGHAVGCAEESVAGEPFAVLLGDDLLDAESRMLDAMIAVRERLGGSVLLLLEVPPEQTALYGIAEVTAVDAGTDLPDVLRVTRLQEKPKPDEAYSHYAIIGRYILDPAVFEVLRDTAPGRGGEVQLTDAIHTLAAMPADAGGGVHGVVFRGLRYDTGDRLEYLKATVQVASRRADLGPAFRAWLLDYARTLDENG